MLCSMFQTMQSNPPPPVKTLFIVGRVSLKYQKLASATIHYWLTNDDFDRCSAKKRNEKTKVIDKFDSLRLWEQCAKSASRKPSPKCNRWFSSPNPAQISFNITTIVIIMITVMFRIIVMLNWLAQQY